MLHDGLDRRRVWHLPNSSRGGGPRVSSSKFPALLMTSNLLIVVPTRKSSSPPKGAASTVVATSSLPWCQKIVTPIKQLHSRSMRAQPNGNRRSSYSNNNNNNNPLVTRVGRIHRYYYYPAPLVLVVVVVGLYVLVVDCNDPLHPWLWSGRGVIIQLSVGPTRTFHNIGRMTPPSRIF